VRFAQVVRNRDKSASAHSNMAFAGERNYFRSVASDGHSPPLCAKKPSTAAIVSAVAANEIRQVFSAPITNAGAVKSMIEKFREKYGAKEVKKYYSKFDVAVLIELV
jgi:hypothetical protein